MAVIWGRLAFNPDGMANGRFMEDALKDKFTPGPWKTFIDDTGGELTGWPISIGAVNEEDKSIVRPGGHYPYEWDAAISQQEAVANANLIAAAPDLYEACALMESAENYYHNKCKECGGEGEPEGCSTCFPLFDDARIARQAALAKARGNT